MKIRGLAACLSACALVIELALIAVHPSSAQTLGQIGLPPWSSFDSDSFSNTDLANLNVHFEIPLRSLPGRALPVNVRLISDTNTLGSPGPLYGAGSQIGWTGTDANYGESPIMGNFVAVGMTPGYIRYTSTPTTCTYNAVSYTFYVYTNFTYLDSRGSWHYYSPNIQVAGLITLSNGTQIQCPSFHPLSGWGTNMWYPADDGSDYYINVSSGSAAPSAFVLNTATGVVNDTVDADGNTNTFLAGQGVTDSSGNKALSVSSNIREPLKILPIPSIRG